MSGEPPTQSRKATPAAGDIRDNVYNACGSGTGCDSGVVGFYTVIVDNAGPSVSSPSISVENTADSGTTWNPGAKNLYVSGTQVWAGAATGVGIPSSQRVKLVYTITERNTGPPALSTGAGYEAFTCPTAPTGLQAAKISFTYGGASTSEVANSSAVTYPSPASKNGSNQRTVLASSI